MAPKYEIPADHIQSEFFPTPQAPIISLLDNYPFHPETHFIEFAAGNGAISRLLRQYYPSSRITQVELRKAEEEALKAFGEVHITDFLDWEIPASYSGENIVWITNPPFSISTKMLDHIFIHDSNAHIIILQRLGFLSSQKRKNWINAHSPSDLLTLAKRPSFHPQGKRDITDYGWFVWNGAGKGMRSV